MAASDGEGVPYEVDTYWEHLVFQYTGLNFNEIGQLNYVDFLRLRRDAYIQRCSATPEGREYLRDAWRMEQTKADKSKLRQRTGKGARKNGQ